MRAEQWKHFATTGENIFTFEWEFAPRLSAVYDLLGDGRHKVSAYYGRYYDPIRNNMTNFAGTLTGSVLEEQVYVLGEWVTYRTRGGPTVAGRVLRADHPDAVHRRLAVRVRGRPRPEHELRARSTSTAARATSSRTTTSSSMRRRRTARSTTRARSTHPNSLFLGLDYFGYTENPGSNFVIATLAGGKRNYQGLEFVFRKRFCDRWQALVSYNWNDAEGQHQLRLATPTSRAT